MRFSTRRERRQQSQPFRHARRERLPQVSLTTKVFAKYHSHPLAARMTLVCLCEDESFVQRSSVPFIYILNGLPLSVSGTLLPIVAVTRLQLFRIKTLLPIIKFWYIFCIPQTRPNRREACCSHLRENKNRLEMECRSGSIQKDTADSTGALTVQINSGSYVNGIHIQLYFCDLYINITHVLDKNQEHTCVFFKIF